MTIDYTAPATRFFTASETHLTISLGSSRSTSFQVARACAGTHLNESVSHHHSSSKDGPTSFSVERGLDRCTWTHSFACCEQSVKRRKGPRPTHSHPQGKTNWLTRRVTTVIAAREPLIEHMQRADGSVRREIHIVTSSAPSTQSG